MVDFSSLLPAGLPATPALLPTLLDLMPLGVIYYTPVVDATGTLTDLTLAYLNPAAQRMTQLPAQPGTTYRQQFPTTDANGAWDFHRRCWLGQEPGHFQFYYAADGFDSYFRVTAQRLGEGLLVVFTDTQDEVRSGVENALRASQAREQAALAEAERQQALLYRVFEEAPAMICILQGPEHVFEFANARYRALVGERPLVGRAFADALPELAGQGILEPLNEVYRTGEPFYASEQRAQLDHTNTAPLELENRYYNLVWQARRDLAGVVDGVLVFAYDVTPQVRARQQVEHLHQVAETARTQAEAERQRLYQVLMRLPANIALLRGPAHTYALVNAEYERLFPGRRLLGRPLREAIPELEGQGYYELLNRVYETGEPYHKAEAEAWADYAGTGELQRRYYRAAFEPIRDVQGRVTEVLSLAVDVTAQVEARQQVEQLNQQLEAARAEVEREQTQLQALLKQAPVAIALLQGEDLRVVSANDLIAELWGHTPAEVVGRPLLEGVPEAQGQGFDDQMREVMRTQTPLIGKETAAVLLRHGQLQTSYFDYVYQPQVDAEGQVQGLIIVATDMTDQVRSRQQVEQLNAELEARVQERTKEALALQADLLAAAQRQAAEREEFYYVLEQAPVGVTLLRGPKLRFDYVNPTFQRIFPDRPLLGLDVAMAFPEGESQGFVALLNQVYQTGIPYFGTEVPFAEAAAAGQPPRTIYFNFSYQAVHEAGNIVGLCAFAFDVTVSVLARQEREARQGELQRLFEQAPVAVAVFRGPQYVIELANAPICALWGRTPQQALGTPLFELLHEVAGQGFEELLDQVRTTGEPFVAHELPSFIDRDGRRDTVYWNFVYAPLREADGTIERVTVVATEGTEQVLARQQVQALNEALTTTNQELGTSNRQLTRTNIDLDNFIYTASHDLKAPITNIEGLLLALEHELPPAARTGDLSLMLNMMQDAVDRFRRTIDHLTDLSRLQKEHNPDAAAVALAPVVEAVRLDLTPLLTQAQGELTVTIPEGLTVTFAEKNLRSVVYNLLSNAFKYRHPDRVPQVQLRSWLADDYVVFEVQDNGLGLDLAQGQERLFAMFQRLHTHVEGTGVGLYMVKRIVENAGGRIEVTSQLGQGSTFRAYFLR